MNALSLSLIVWLIEAAIILSIVSFIFHKFKFNYKLIVTFIFVTLLWSSFKIIDEYKYLAIDSVGIETGRNNSLMWATLAYGLSIVLLRYPLTFYSQKFHAKTITIAMSALVVGIISFLTFGAMITKNPKVTEILLILSSASLGIAYAMFSTTSTLVANRDDSKKVFSSVLIIVMAYFVADAVVSPIKVITRYEFVYDDGWSGYWIMWLFSGLFGLGSAIMGIIIAKWEPHPHYDEHKKVIYQKIKKQLPKNYPEFEEFKIFGKTKKVCSVNHVWFSKLFILSITGFAVVFMNTILSNAHFGSYVLKDMFELPKNNYDKDLKEQLIVFYESIYSLFSLIGFVLAVHWLIPKIGFTGTISIGIAMITLYSFFGGVNMLDSNMRSPILMFITYSLLGAGFGITYYSMISMLLLMEVANPVQKKLSGLGLWLLATGPAILIGEMIFATSIISSKGIVNYEVLGYMTILMIPIGIMSIIWIDTKLDNHKYGSIFEQSKPQWARKKSII